MKINGNFCIFSSLCSQSTPTDKIYHLIIEVIKSGNGITTKISEVMDRCTTKGFKPDQIDKCIENYEKLNVWQVNQARTSITLV